MKYAFSTQSYKGDFAECRLLCESMDRFAPDVDHFIFVNDEDWALFQSLNYGRHMIRRKSECIPWYFFRFPFKIKDHYFWVSPFTLPMRGWIYQQVCKLAVFDVIGKDGYDVVINLDSEAVLIKEFRIEDFKKDGKFKLFRNTNTTCDPHQWQYTAAIQKFFKGTMPQDQMDKYQYMDIATIFVKENLDEMLAAITKNSPYRNWKLWMASTLKFSEFFTYGNYVVHKMNLKNHYLTEEHGIRWIEYGSHLDIQEMDKLMDAWDKEPMAHFLWVQKIRHTGLDDAAFFKEIESYFHDRWQRI